ncbi:MAG TPA: penicillin-binding protein 2 [Myxococcaceae bacterium]|nr:penicillin-binding protein 2 [Myxococcaceae bacterium]
MDLGQNSAGKDLKQRYLWVGMAMMAGLLMLAVRLYRLQITRHEEFTAKSVQNFVKDVRVRADRGFIRDRRGETLVDNRPSFDVFVTPYFCQKCYDETLPKLGQWLGWNEDQVAGVVALVKQGKKSPFTPVAVRLDLNRDELDAVMAHKWELPGVDVVPMQHRSYRMGPMMAHVLGYMNEITQEELDRLNQSGSAYALGDYIGRRGIERSFESALRGVDGSRKEVVNAKGETIADFKYDGTEEVVQPRPGNNVVLSIDNRLQQLAEEQFPGVTGSMVAVDVKTGFILAVVSKPSFDPNILTGRVTSSEMAKLARDPLQPMIFRASQQHYSPGSTFKVVTALAALKSGVFNTHSMVHCPGGYHLGARYWRCHKDSGHGGVDVNVALQKSCDTYFYKAADILGLDPIASMGKAFGLGQPTGITAVAEVPGIMPDTAYHDRVTPGGYQKGMALNSAIGQGDDTTTPLQLAMLYAAIANGGTLYQPQLVRRIESPDGTVVQEFQPKVVRDVDLHPEHRRIVVKALSAVVNEPGGTAYATRLKDIKVVGKTGTAQVSRLGAVRLKTHQMDYWERDHAWFASFAPEEDPEIAVVVLNEHGGHGGTDAAPLAMKVIQKYFDLKKEDAGASTLQVTAPENTQVPRPPPPPAPAVPAKPALPKDDEARRSFAEQSPPKPVGR